MAIRLSQADAKRLGIQTPKRQSETNRALVALTKSASATSGPQGRLWLLVKERWPEAKAEYKGAVPGRKFRIDIAFPEQKLAVEVDGWQWHGKHLNDFKKCRSRQNLLTLQGWAFLRFTASEIKKEPNMVIDMITEALSNLSSKKVE